MLSRLRKTISRALVVALVVLVAVGAAMPAWARLVGGPEAHACTCDTHGGHSHCACPLCFPELRDDFASRSSQTDGTAPLVESSPKVTGRCGKDDPGWRTLACAAVPASGFVVDRARPEHRLDPIGEERAPSQWSRAPDLPPPRAALSPSTPS